MKKIKSDTEFSATARELQNAWRDKKSYPIGSYKQKQADNSYKEVELGNYIEKSFALETEANFLSENIRKVAKNASLSKEKGAKISETRFYTNLLSSQPLAFNLFAELSLNLQLASNFFRKQFPERIAEVTKIIFEHSDGRGDCSYTCDHSAFDVFVEYKSKDGKNGFIGIEVKYAESLKDKPAKFKSRYAELTENSGLFKEDSIELLRLKPLEQIWRDHLLSLAHLKHENKKYEEGFFIYLFPKENKQCQDAVDKYVKQFSSYDPTTKRYDECKTGFYIRHLKEFAIDLKNDCKDQWLEDFLERYFN